MEGIGFLYGKAEFGGAIKCVGAQPTITGCHFLYCTSELSGGAIYGLASAPQIEDCEFRYNTAAGDGTGSGGGALYFRDSPGAAIRNCLFDRNRALCPVTGGGAAYIRQSSLTISNCRFESNRAIGDGGNAGGGALYLCSHSDASIQDCLFLANVAGDSPYGSFSRGGGVLCQQSSPILMRCVFVRNEILGYASTEGGGGLYCYNSLQPIVQNCTFYRNHGMRGGAIFTQTNSAPTIVNSIISASTHGGALYVADEGSIPSLSCCNIQGNVGGDWTEPISDQLAVEGNFSAPPLFCNPYWGNPNLFADSPCAPEQQPECGLIGAGPVDCTPPPTPRCLAVRPDGQGEYSCIQHALCAAYPGDIIDLADGLYVGEGNRDLEYEGKAITVRSASNDPSLCIIDCSDSLVGHYGAMFIHAEPAGTTLEGLTLQGSTYSAITCKANSAPTIRNVTIRNNASYRGSGVYANAADVALLNCTIHSNAVADAGTILFRGCRTLIQDCTLHANSGGFSDSASTVACIQGTVEIIDHSFIVATTNGRAVYGSKDGSVILTCCDLYGNVGGDWVGTIAAQYGQNGNSSLDPMFCNAANGDSRLQPESPYVQHIDVVHGPIGAWGVGCERASGVEKSIPASAHRPLWLCATPNPFSVQTRILYDAPGREAAILEIHDATGRLLCTLTDDSGRTGMRNLMWDGCDQAGRAVRAGVYFGRLRCGGLTATARLQLIR